MRQVTDTPTVLDCAMNFVEAADEMLKKIAWPGYLCFTREKEHYELPTDFSVKYEDLLPVPQEPTTNISKEDVKLLNDSRNEFGRGVRQQSVRNSFTKDKAGTLPFYMYTSLNSDKESMTNLKREWKSCLGTQHRIVVAVNTWGQHSRLKTEMKAIMFIRVRCHTLQSMPLKVDLTLSLCFFWTVWK